MYTDMDAGVVVVHREETISTLGALFPQLESEMLVETVQARTDISSYHPAVMPNVFLQALLSKSPSS
jgi:hypothetical protein